MGILDGHDRAQVERAAALLAAGDLVAFPTETVYGLGARADTVPKPTSLGVTTMPSDAARFSTQIVAVFEGVPAVVVLVVHLPPR